MADLEPADLTPVTIPPVLLDAVVRRFDPLEVILFGSRARGDFGPDSDWDLLVVLDDDAPPENLELRAGCEVASGSRVLADVVPCRKHWFDYKRDVVNSLAWIAATQGVVVYERAERPQAA